MEEWKNKIIQGDCLEVMKDIPDGSIDMILADLPYGSTKCSWDIIIPFDKLWKEYNRIIKDDGAVVLFGQEPFSSLLRISNLKNYKYDWYWRKERLTNVLQVKKRAGKTIETISVFYKKQCLYNPQFTKYDGKLRTNKIKDGSLGKLIDSGNKKAVAYKDDRKRYPTQLLEFKRDILTSNLHPTQKPIALCEYLIKTYTKKNDIVLDNVAGSGTIGIACQNTSRKYILIEKEQEYIEIIKTRLTKTL